MSKKSKRAIKAQQTQQQQPPPQQQQQEGALLLPPPPRPSSQLRDNNDDDAARLSKSTKEYLILKMARRVFDETLADPPQGAAPPMDSALRFAMRASAAVAEMYEVHSEELQAYAELAEVAGRLTAKEQARFDELKAKREHDLEEFRRSGVDVRRDPLWWTMAAACYLPLREYA